MQVKNTFHQIRVVLFINSSRTVVLPIQIIDLV